MKVEVVKAIVLVSLFVITLVGSVIPVKLVRKVRHNANSERRRKQMRIISFFSCFAGGVFLGTCLLDLFPEVRSKLSDVLDQYQIITSFPIAEFTMVFGFFTVLIVEQIVLSVKERTLERALEINQPLLNGQRIYRSNSQDSITSVGSIEGISDRPRSTKSSKSSYGSTGSIQNGEGGHFHEHSVHEDPSSHSTLRSLLLTLALSLHSVFEGLAVGLQGNVDQVLSIFVALVIHKTVLACSLGLNLAESKLTQSRMIQACLVFAFASPVGVAIGIGITDADNGHIAAIVSGTLQGIACGTFLYITFFEVLPHEMNAAGDRLLKVCCIILGFAAIASLMLIHPDELRASCVRSAVPVHNDN